MKLLNEATPVETFGVTETSSFSISLNSKAFRVLSDTLYSNKVGSIVREISTNAVDAHIMAGKEDVPFEIHLPNAFEPWFSVKDFGIGLTPDAIKNVFTVYFQSTKDNSNQCTGMLGLGSKTPFAYTDQFTVTSIVNGTKRIYSCFINSTGVPDIALMDESETTEENGVEIRLSAKREDYSRFADEVVNQLHYFKVKPILQNTSRVFNSVPADFMYESDTCKVHNTAHGSHGLIAVQGNVGYPIDLAQLHESNIASNYTDALTFLKQLQGHCTEFYFPIGSIGVTASREGIEYDKTTVENILQAASELEKNFLVKLVETMKELPDDWERCRKLEAYPFGMRFADNIGLASQFKINSYYRTVHVDMTPITEKIVKVDHVYSSGTTISVDTTVGVCEINAVASWVRNSRRQRNRLQDKLPVIAKDEIVFIFRDKSTLAERKISHYLTKNNFRAIYEVTLLDNSKTYDQLIKDIKKHLTFDVNCVLLSSIELPEQLKAPAIRQGAAQYYRWTASVGTDNNSLRMWDADRSNALVDIKDVKYYLTHDGSSCNLLELREAVNGVKELGLDPVDSLIMISAKKEALIVEKPNFRNVEKLREEVKEKLQNDILRLRKEFRRADLSSRVHNALHEFDSLIRLVGNEAAGTDFGKLIHVHQGIRARGGRVSESLHSLSQKLKTVDGSEARISKMNESRAAKICGTIKKYPLLKQIARNYYSSGLKTEDVVQYVKAIDSYNSQTTVNV